MMKGTRFPTKLELLDTDVDMKHSRSELPEPSRREADKHLQKKGDQA